MATDTAKATKTPTTAFLKKVIGRPVMVKLTTGEIYNGVLSCLDGYLNIVLEQTEEIFEGKVKRRYGDCLLRGNNVMYITLQQS